MSQIVNDADNAAFFFNELQHIKSETIKVARPLIRWRELIPPSSDPAPAGAQTITYRLLDSVGQAKFISAYDTELPRADVFGKEVHATVQELGCSYAWTEGELRAMRMAGRSLQRDRRDAAHEAMERKLQNAAYFGDADLNLPGLFRSPNVATVNAADVGGDITWADKLAADKWQAVRQDVSNVLNAIPEQSNGFERANTFVMPLVEYNLISNYLIGVDSSRTLLQAIKEAHPGVEFDWVLDLATASPSNGKLCIAYDRSPRVLGREVPQEPYEMPPQADGIEHVVNVLATTGGCHIKYPAAVRYFEGF